VSNHTVYEIIPNSTSFYQQITVLSLKWVSNRFYRSFLFSEDRRLIHHRTVQNENLYHVILQVINIK